MNAPNRGWLILYQYIAGLCDTATGLLLIVAPASTLRLVGLTIIPEPVVFVRYIGVFVLSVGLTYLWAVARWPLTSHAHIGWSTQWKITALVRTLVAVFVVWQIASSALEGRWISVALSDGAFATIQWIGLRKGWLERAG
ncbi:MAG TPA: hypothetical protein VGG62_04960 [Terracidiphilus sp.]|jgi:uncharacterized protein YjeT (DUF2065 family)